MQVWLGLCPKITNHDLGSWFLGYLQSHKDLSVYACAKIIKYLKVKYKSKQTVPHLMLLFILKFLPTLFIYYHIMPKIKNKDD